MKPRVKVVTKIGIESILITIAVITIFVVTLLINVPFGILSDIFLIFALFLYIRRAIASVDTYEKYIATRSRSTREFLHEMSEVILSTVPGAIPLIDHHHCPVYCLSIARSFRLISMQAVFFGRYILICPFDSRVFSVFSDRLQVYENDGRTDIYLPSKKPLDRELLRDILLYRIKDVPSAVSSAKE